MFLLAIEVYLIVKLHLGNYQSFKTIKNDMYHLMIITNNDMVKNMHEIVIEEVMDNIKDIKLSERNMVATLLIATVLFAVWACAMLMKR